MTKLLNLAGANTICLYQMILRRRQIRKSLDVKVLFCAWLNDINPMSHVSAKRSITIYYV